MSEQDRRKCRPGRGGVRHRQVVGLQTRQGQGGEHPLAHEVVAESESIRPRGPQEMAPGGFVDRIAQLVTRQLSEGLEQRDVEIATYDRRRDQHPLRRLAEPLEPPPDDAAHAVGQLQVLFGKARLHAPTAAEHRFRLRDVQV